MIQGILTSRCMQRPASRASGIPGPFRVLVLAAAFVMICLAFPAAQSHAQQGGTLSGKIYNSVTRKPVDFGTVAIVELQIKERTAPDGAYSIALPKPGDYTVVVSAAGLMPVKTVMRIEGNTTRDFTLAPPKVQGAALTVIGQRDIQKIGRYTMTAKEIKEVPASFGDSVSALTALPGVIRTGGFFGPLVIRGADPNNNRYLIDDIPIYNPQHFFGVHSVISNELMSEIDLYASAYPAQFGNATAALININTVDAVKEFGGLTDMSIISANVFIQAPFSSFTSDHAEGGKVKGDKTGYVIAAGRYGYYQLFLPFILRAAGAEFDSVPEYWDYQMKTKFYLGNEHSITLLFMGSKDTFVFVNDTDPEEEVDPLLEKWDFETDVASHSQGLYYTFEPSERFRNTLLAYNSYNDSYNYINIDNDKAADWTKGLNFSTKPDIFGIKEKVRYEWWKNHAELRAGLEYALYDFRYEGSKLIPLKPILGIPDFSDDSLFRRETVTSVKKNHTVGGYLEQKFTWAGLAFVPGVRFDYLSRSDTATVDPRGLLSYEFPWDMTLSVAGGQYSSFIQTNPYVFNLNGDLATIGSLKPEIALHRAAGVEQRLGLFAVKLEGFYNTYRNLVTSDAESPTGYANAARQKAYGLELMLRMDRRENEDGLYGWINYTWTQSKYKVNVNSADPSDDAWWASYLDFNYEQEHAMKLVGGYAWGRHTLSTRFQLYSSTPYTPIVGGKLSPDPTPPGSQDRYVQIFGEPNSRHYPVDYRLDLRYANKTTHEWGHVSWYLELISVNGLAVFLLQLCGVDIHEPINTETWNYTEPYQKGKNPKREHEGGIPFIPNFGVEVKF